MASAFVVIAQTRRISRAQLTQTAQEWQDVATARHERVTLLQQQINQLQAQLLLLTAKIATMDRDREFLMDRNLGLEQKLLHSDRRIAMLEDMLRTAHVQVPREEK